MMIGVMWKRNQQGVLRRKGKVHLAEQAKEGTKTLCGLVIGNDIERIRKVESLIRSRDIWSINWGHACMCQSCRRVKIHRGCMGKEDERTERIKTFLGKN